MDLDKHSGRRLADASGISYERGERTPFFRVGAVVSGTRFSRALESVFLCARPTRTVRLPRTIEICMYGAFCGQTELKSVVLNEGLKQIENRAFFETGLGRVLFPASVRTISAEAFSGCKALKEIKFRPNCALRLIGGACFAGCDRLEVIFVESGCAVDVRRCVGDRVRIAVEGRISVGGQSLEALRAARELVIPDGVEEVGDYWFEGSGIESVVIPASVRTIGREAFCKCGSLKRVTFAEGSALESVGERCFWESAIEKLALPAALRSVGEDAFKDCANLKLIRIEEDSQVRIAGAGIPIFVRILRGHHKLCKIAVVVLPDDIRRVGHH